MKSRPAASFLLAIILVLSGVIAPVFAYSSNSNVFVGQAPDECAAQNNPNLLLTFNQTMITNAPTGDQWSAQTNAYPYTNTAGTDFWQFNMAIDNNGQVYGAISIWVPTGLVWDMHTPILATASNLFIQPNDQFIVELFQADGQFSGNLWSVSFNYYNAYSGTTYQGVISIPSMYYTQIASWQLNIVGENSGSNPNAIFNSGGGTTEYYSLVSSSQYMSSQPSCGGTIQGQGLVTAELSNMHYGNPTTGCTYTCIFQGFRHA